MKLERPDKESFYYEPLMEYHLDALKKMLEIEPIKALLVKLTKFLEFNGVVKFQIGSKFKEVLESMVCAAENGQLSITRKLIINLLNAAQKLQPESDDDGNI